MNSRQYIKMAFQNLILPVVYRVGCLQKTDPQLVVFADAHHNSRPANMDLLAQACLKEGYRVEEICLDYQKNPPLKVLKSMIRFMLVYARAGVVVICDNFLPAAGCRKRKGTRVIQLWHACGSLKRFGYDTDDDIPAGYKGNVYRNTDLVTVSAPWCEQHFASAMRLPAKHVRALGVSRTDRYYDPAWREQARKKFEDLYPEAAGKKIVLWAPTFRGSAAAPELIPFDDQALQAQLGDDWRVIVSTHPHMKDGKVLITTEELFVSTDCLIADYSSLIYEYLLMAQIMGDKHLVLYIPDFDTYIQKRGFYMDYSEIPGVQVRNFDELAGAVEQAGQTDPEEMQTVLTQFLAKYMSACDGNSTQRIMNRIRRGR